LLKSFEDKITLQASPEKLFRSEGELKFKVISTGDSLRYLSVETSDISINNADAIPSTIKDNQI